MRTHVLFSSAVCLAVTASVGCGSLDDHTGTPTTLATVTGELSNPQSLTVGNNVRVAVVWLNAGSGYSVAEDLPVQPVFPSQFVIQLDQPPPQAAMFTPDGSGSSAFQASFGFVVAYEDVNGNGMLDLVTNDAGAFVDQIVGANESLALVYVQGPLPSDANLADTFGKLPSQGYNLYALSACQAASDAPDGGTAGPSAPDGGACIPAEWFGMDTSYDLQVSSDPEVNQLMCSTYGQGSGSASGGSSTPWDVGQQGTPPGGYPAAGASGLTCLSSSSYSYAPCQTIHNGLCEESVSCSQSTVELGAAATPPGWPCP